LSKALSIRLAKQLQYVEVAAVEEIEELPTQIAPEKGAEFLS